MKKYLTALILLLVLQVPSEGKGVGLKAEYFYIPHFTVKEDKNDWMPSSVGLGAELVSGHGGALRISMDATEERAGISFGGLYMTNKHAVKNSQAEIRAHSFYFEILGRIDMTENEITPYVELAGGIGAMIFDYSDPRGKARGGGALELRLNMGIRFWDTAFIQLGGGQYLWGYPGETIGYGGFTTIGLGIKF